jgi:hypothetical protein
MQVVKVIVITAITTVIVVVVVDDSMAGTIAIAFVAACLDFSS